MAPINIKLTGDKILQSKIQTSCDLIPGIKKFAIFHWEIQISKSEAFWKSEHYSLIFNHFKPNLIKEYK